MRFLTLLVTALFLTAAISESSFANGIDDKCPQLTYKTAPVVKADLYICHKMYAIAYSYAAKNPIYTTEFLTANHTGDSDRPNDFRVDPAVPKQYQSKPSDYEKAGTSCGPVAGSKRTSSCDQGHMTPDQDFSNDITATKESFFMSNMVPQNFKNNEVIWKSMEVKFRKYVATHPAGIYVITGPVYKTASPTKLGADQVWIPDALFKIAIDAQTGQSIAFYMPNAPETELSTFVVNLATIELVTGIKFDDSLNKFSIAKFNAW